MRDRITRATRQAKEHEHKHADNEGNENARCDEIGNFRLSHQQISQAGLGHKTPFGRPGNLQLQHILSLHGG